MLVFLLIFFCGHVFAENCCKILPPLKKGLLKNNRLDKDKVYTLYRSSTLPYTKIHMATFDANVAFGNKENISIDKYNRFNCEDTASRWQKTAISLRYWCERGYFKPMSESLRNKLNKVNRY